MHPQSGRLLLRQLKREIERKTGPVSFDLLSLDQIRAVIQAAAVAGYRTLRRATYSTLCSLLACTGLRVSEAIRLRYDDLTPDGLIIRRTKFGKNRLVPLHPTARAGLERYLRQRRPFAPADDHVFVSRNRTALRIQAVEQAFRTAVERAGLPRRPGRQSWPTPHSLRHSFATRALQSCPRDRDAITRQMVALSTYLGHSTAAQTYWYLEAIPNLMQDIAEQAEQAVMGAHL